MESTVWISKVMKNESGRQISYRYGYGTRGMGLLTRSSERTTNLKGIRLAVHEFSDTRAKYHLKINLKTRRFRVHQMVDKLSVHLACMRPPEPQNAT